MGKGGTVVTYKYAGTEISKISTFDLYQTKIFESNSFLNRQRHCTTLPCENGRNREPNVIEIKQRNWAVSLETRDNNYYRLEAAGTHRNGNFAQKYFNKSARAGECPK